MGQSKSRRPSSTIDSQANIKMKHFKKWLMEHDRLPYATAEEYAACLALLEEQLATREHLSCYANFMDSDDLNLARLKSALEKDHVSAGLDIQGMNDITGAAFTSYVKYRVSGRADNTDVKFWMRQKTVREFQSWLKTHAKIDQANSETRVLDLFTINTVAKVELHCPSILDPNALALDRFMYKLAVNDDLQALSALYGHDILPTLTIFHVWQRQSPLPLREPNTTAMRTWQNKLMMVQFKEWLVQTQGTSARRANDYVMALLDVNELISSLRRFYVHYKQSQLVEMDRESLERLRDYLIRDKSFVCINNARNGLIGSALKMYIDYHELPAERRLPRRQPTERQPIRKPTKQSVKPVPKKPTKQTVKPVPEKAKAVPQKPTRPRTVAKDLAQTLEEFMSNSSWQTEPMVNEFGGWLKWKQSSSSIVVKSYISSLERVDYFVRHPPRGSKKYVSSRCEGILEYNKKELCRLHWHLKLLSELEQSDILYRMCITLTKFAEYRYDISLD